MAIAKISKLVILLMASAMSLGCGQNRNIDCFRNIEGYKDDILTLNFAVHKIRHKTPEKSLVLTGTLCVEIGLDSGYLIDLRKIRLKSESNNQSSQFYANSIASINPCYEFEKGISKIEVYTVFKNFNEKADENLTLIITEDIFKTELP